ncbi:phage head morphogenesis protein, partial [Escherichia coli]|nr:phage head morphogenesis protein [Escherichia coli]
ATQPVLLNDDGTIYNKGIADRLTAERKAWSTDEDS